MRRVRAAILLLGAVGIGGAAFTAYAQLGQNTQLTLTLSPLYPRPYETVTIIPQSSLIDLSASTVTITANGVVVSTGSGSEAAYVTVGGPGTATTVNVRAVHGGQTYAANVTIRPADVALITEPYSTTHPFYEGGSLVASEGRVRLVAVPDLRTSGGTAISPANLVYTWRNGEQILQGASGIGKSVLTASAPVRYRDARITVTVSTQDQSIVAAASTVISPVDPLMRVYRKDPLLGPWYETALPANLTLAGVEETFHAVPYYFSEAPPIAWQVNGAPSDTDKDITVRATGSGAGTAVLTASARLANSLQAAETALRIRFGDEGGLGIFGF